MTFRFDDSVPVHPNSPPIDDIDGLESASLTGGYGLVINGDSLVYALRRKYDRLFLEVGSLCVVRRRVRHMLPHPYCSPFLVCNLLSCDAAPKGASRRSRQAPQKSGDAERRRRRKRRLNDKNGAYWRRHLRYVFAASKLEIFEPKKCPK